MTQTEPWSIPGHWKWQVIGDKADVIGGGTPSTKNDANYHGGEIPWITPADLSGHTEKYIQRGRRNITDEGLRGSSARLMRAGTVLFSSRAPIGYVAIAANPVSTNQGFKSFVPDDDVDSDYLYYYLQRARELALQLASGTTFPEISGKNAKHIPLPLPPLDEQRQIVEAIETQFARLDDAVAALERARTRLKRYRASVLKSACEGTLVPTEADLALQEGRAYEPASVLLKRIQAERDAAPSKRRGRKASTPVDTSDLPELPDGWAWTTVDEVATEVRYGSSSKTHEDDSGIPVLRMGNIQDGELNLASLKYLDLDHHEFPELLLQQNDVLFNRTNSAELVGKSAIYREIPAKCSYASYLIRVRIGVPSLAEFLVFYINSTFGREWVRSVVNQQVGQANVNGTKLKALNLLVPPLAEQERIVEEVERRLSVIEQMEASVETNLKRAESLRQSILRQAFSGRLT